MHLPDNESDYGDFEIEPEDDADELSPEALAWQLLLLVNPGDEETAHTVNDSVSLDDVVKSTEFYAVLTGVLSDKAS